MSESKNFNLSFQKTTNISNRNIPFLSVGSSSFQYFFNIKNNISKSLIIFYLSIFMGCVNFLLIERTGIYTPGIIAIYQSLARLINYLTKSSLDASTRKLIYLSLFWGLNILFNLFFAVFCFKKIGKVFTSLTVLYICTASLTGLALSYIPERVGLKDFYIFSNPKSTHGTFINNDISFLPWPIPHSSSEALEGYKIPIVFLYGFFYAVISSFVSLIIYSLGSGTGGIDWIVFYLYKKKSYSSKKLLFYSGLIISFTAYVVGTYIPYALSSNYKSFKFLIPNLLSPIFLSTLIAIFTKKIIFNVFYPQFKFMKVKVFSNKFLDIRNALLEKKFPHSFTITKSFGSYHLKTQTQLEFICLFIEIHELTDTVRNIDKNCLIISTPIHSLNGYIKAKTDFK